MGERKVRSNKGKSRGPYTSRLLPASVVGSATKCVTAFINNTLLFTKSYNPFLKTKAGNRYSCTSELKRKKLNTKKKNQKATDKKPSIAPSMLKKGNVRNGYYVKVIKKPTTAGYMKVWRKQ